MRSFFDIEAGPKTGGMSQVYRAVDDGGRRVAVKVIRPDLRARPEVRKRFEREAEVGTDLPPHPYLAQLLDFDLEGDPAYLVFEHVDGRPPSAGRVEAAIRSFGPHDTVPGAAGDFAFGPETGNRDVRLRRPGTREPHKPRALPVQLGDHCPRTGRAGPC